MKVFGKVLLLAAIFASSAHAQSGGDGVAATPTVYEVTLQKIEFKNQAGTFVSFAEGSYTFDIASASAGAAVGSIGAGNFLPLGTYTAARITISRSFVLSGQIADAGSGQPCRTRTGNGFTNNDSFGLVNLGVGTADAAAATRQTLVVPTSTRSNTLKDNGIEELGSTSLRFEVPLSFTVAETTGMPSVGVNFNVTNAVKFQTTGAGTCIIYPQPPSVVLRQ